MRFITVLTASLAVGSAVAATKEASFQPFTVSGDDIEFNPAVYTTENFTASDGETYEITFLSGAPDVEGRSAFQRRQQDSDDPKNRWRAGSLEKSCPFGSITGDTGPNAPTTGRCIAVRDWCAKNPGHWELYRSESLMGYYPLVSSGKTGTTACHFGVRGRSALDVVGSYDVRDWVKSSLDRYRRDFNGVERVRARGEVTRETGGLCRNGVRPYGLDWKLDTLQAMY